MDALPLTTNMKVDRGALPAAGAGRTGTGDAGEVRPYSEAEALLARIWEEVLGVEGIGPEENFFDLGGDSVLSIQVCARARRRGLHLTAREIFEHATISRLAAVARWESHRGGEQDLVVGPVPLTPTQRCFFEQGPTNPALYAMSLVLEVERALDPALLSAAVERLIIHHDALRLRFTRSGGEWEQKSALPEGGVPVRRVDLRNVKGAALSEAVTAVDAELRQSLNLSRGPLVSVASIECGRRRKSLVSVVAHHLVCDTVSAHILLDDLEATYRQLALGKPLILPPKTASFREWSEQLTGYAQSPECRAGIPYWLGQLEDTSCGLPVDLPGGANRDDLVRTACARVGANETEALVHGATGATRSRHATAKELLLGAFIHAIALWHGTRSLAIYIESHAREELCPGLDVSRTVGWFACGYPVKFDVSAERPVRDTVDNVRHVLSNVPGNGLGYGALRYLTGDQQAAELRACPIPEVKFNYLGIVGFGHRRPRMFIRPRVPNTRQAVVFPERRHPLEVTAFVMDGCLHVTVAYSEGIHHPATIHRLLSRFVASLRLLASGDDGTEGRWRVRDRRHSAPRRPLGLACEGSD